MKETYYFPHDYNAHSDDKILQLRIKLGLEGYGMYWYVIEQLASAGGKLNISVIDTFAYDMHSDRTTVENVIKNHELFEIEGEIFFSKRLLKHLKERKSKSEKAKKSAKDRRNKRDAIALQSDSDRNAKERKGKEKEKKEIIPSVIESLSDSLKKPMKDFIEMRVKIKKPPTERALELLIESLKRLGKDELEQIAIINQSITKSRQDFYPLKEEPKTKQELNKEISERIRRQKDLVTNLPDDGFDEYLAGENS